MTFAPATLALALLASPAPSTPPPAEGPWSFRFTVTGGLSQIGRKEERPVTAERWTTVDRTRSLADLREARGADAVRNGMLRRQSGTMRKSVASDPSAFRGAGSLPSLSFLPGGSPVDVATFRNGAGDRFRGRRAALAGPLDRGLADLGPRRRRGVPRTPRADEGKGKAAGAREGDRRPSVRRVRAATRRPSARSAASAP